MALDPQAKYVIDFFARAGLPSYASVGAVTARTIYRKSRMPMTPPKPQMASVADRTIAGPVGPIPIRLYRPIGSRPEQALPALVYFHGGGWTIGDLETHDVICRTLGNRAGCAIVAVDYRLAPEHKFPAGLDDCWAATRWVLDEGGASGIDPTRVAVGGDSAGGNLAAVVALMARDAAMHLAFQLLLYPQVDLACEAPSHTLFAEGYLLTRPAIAWFIEGYANDPSEVQNWRVSPLRAASLAGVAPAFLATAGFDPLRDEGKSYADRLTASGVATHYVCYDGMMHGFGGMGSTIDAANRLLDESGAALAEALAAG